MDKAKKPPHRAFTKTIKPKNIDDNGSRKRLAMALASTKNVRQNFFNDSNFSEKIQMFND